DATALAQDPALRIAISPRRLDDHLDARERRDVGRSADPSDERVTLLRIELAPLDRPAGRRIEPLASARQEVFGGLHHGDIDPDASDDVSDPGTHQTETHHADPRHVL